MAKPMNVSLPPDLMEFVAQQPSEGRFHNQSEVVRAGLRLEGERRAIARLHTALAVGIADMEADRTKPPTDDLLADIAERGRKRSAARKPGSEDW